jgi:hypothetical protein
MRQVVIMLQAAIPQLIPCPFVTISRLFKLSGQGMKLKRHVHLISRLRDGAIPLLSHGSNNFMFTVRKHTREICVFSDSRVGTFTAIHDKLHH